MVQELPSQRPRPNPYQTRPLHPSPGLQGPILSQREMCNSRAGAAPPPGGQAGTPRPRVQLDVGPGKEALVRHGAGGQAERPPRVPAAWPMGAGEQLRGSRVGRLGPPRPLPVPHNVDPGTGFTHEGALTPARQLPEALPVPGHYCFSAPMGAEGHGRQHQEAVRRRSPKAASMQGQLPAGRVCRSLAGNSGRPNGHPRGAPSSPRPGPGHRGRAGGRGRWHRSLSLGEEERGTGNGGEVVRAGDTNQKGKIQFL